MRSRTSWTDTIVDPSVIVCEVYKYKISLKIHCETFKSFASTSSAICVFLFWGLEHQAPALSNYMHEKCWANSRAQIRWDLKWDLRVWNIERQAQWKHMLAKWWAQMTEQRWWTLGGEKFQYDDRNPSNSTWYPCHPTPYPLIKALKYLPGFRWTTEMTK